VGLFELVDECFSGYLLEWVVGESLCLVEFVWFGKGGVQFS